jgi:Type II secretion system (T2SS), protein G
MSKRERERREIGETREKAMAFSRISPISRLSHSLSLSFSLVRDFVTIVTGNMETQVKSRKPVLIGILSVGSCSLVASLLLLAAPNETISVKKARELIQNIAGASLKRDQVQIKDINSGIGGDVIVEAQIETSFRLTKDNGDWRIAEVRLGDRHWESFELIEEAVQREKVRRTTVLLKELADALNAYHQERGRFAVTEEIAELLDYLSPRYITRPPRFDLWGKQFEYRGTASSYRLMSTGPDRKSGTRDDLIIENGVIRTAVE